MDKYIESIQGLIITYGARVVLAIVVLLVGLWLIGKVVKTMGNVMIKRNADPSLIPFLLSITGILLKVMLVVSVVGMIGVETTSFIAVLGDAGLAIGMALSGTLQNFAGGVIILMLKPFRVGHYIEAQGHSGTVSEIQIFNTFLKTPDNKTVILPNGALSSGAMTNYSTEPTRRVDLTFRISYTDDIDQAKNILKRLLSEDERVLQNPAPVVVILSLGDSSVNIGVRPWVKSEDYWGLLWDMQGKVKKAFDAEGISIPFPQMDVHVQK